jgi:hypothetical protein
MYVGPGHTCYSPKTDPRDARIAQLERELAEAKKNETRYLFLRDGDPEETGWFLGRYPSMFNDEEMDWSDKDAVDVAIDAASKPAAPTVDEKGE